MGGDISADPVNRRLLVAVDVVFPVTEDSVVRRWSRKRSPRRSRTPQQALLAGLWLWTTRHPARLGLLCYCGEDEAQSLYEALSESASNPFHSVEAHASPAELATALAYRPDVLGVVDPDNALALGSRYMDLWEVI